MPDVAWLTLVLHAPAAGIVAAAAGFVGSLVILWAAWRTVKLRRAIVEGVKIDTADPAILAGAAVLLGKLNDQQLRSLNDEHRLYRWGAGLLAANFLLSLLRELF